MLEQDVYRELEEAVGAENISREPAILDSYTFQTVFNPHESPWLLRPEAVLLPASSEEVQAVLKVCNRYGVKFKAFSTGWGVFNAPGNEGEIILDLKRMNRIIEIDERNMFAIVEPYVTCNQLQAEAMRKGLNCHIIGAGPNTSVLASCTSVGGVGWTGLSMGYNCRNVLGVEWVLPGGELVRLGSPGSGPGWFYGDGPGPSMRGVMRGLFGAMGGLGVFTRVAVKLYNWPGPRELDVSGMMWDVKTQVPENYKAYLIIFPDMEGFTNATYAIGEAEIGFLHSRNPVGMMSTFLFPGLVQKTSRFPLVREAMNACKEMVTVVLFPSSRDELEYQQRALKEIIDEEGGVLIDTDDLPVLKPVFFCALIRATLSAFVFKAGGSFGSSLVGEETTDSGAMQADLAAERKEKYIRRGEIIDDLADNTWGSIYENNLFAHYESLMCVNRRDPKQLRWMDVDDDLIQELLRRKWGIGIGLSGAGTVVHNRFGPQCSNYHIWQRRIKKALDPDNLSDSIGYIDPGD